MCGSGTVVRLAAEAGCVAIGADVDPLAVLLTRTAAIPEWSADLQQRAADVVTDAKRLSAMRPSWISSDSETARFVDYWFGSQQADGLSRLARVLQSRPRRDDPLRVALSRLIVTKDGGASLARDTAHSRPHRTRDESSFDVLDGFVQSAGRISSLIGERSGDCRPSVRRCDARTLSFVQRASIDLVVTSPPYLNAIDYLRGHRMSLIWLGWTTEQLRALRGIAIGAERGLAAVPAGLRDIADAGNPRMAGLTPRHRHLVFRFTKDVHDLCRTLARVTKPKGMLVLVVADSQLGGHVISNSGICLAAARHHGFALVATSARAIPARHRYLPPPAGALNSLARRMKSEVVFTFRRADR